VEKHNGWTYSDKAAYLIDLNKPAAHVLHSNPTGVRYKEVTGVLENFYGEQHLVEAFYAHLKGSTQHAGKSLK
jgi:hypothetical protein